MVSGVADAPDRAQNGGRVRGKGERVARVGKQPAAGARGARPHAGRRRKGDPGPRPLPTRPGGRAARPAPGRVVSARLPAGLRVVPRPRPDAAARETSPQPVGSPLRPLPWRGAVATALVLGCAAAASFWALSSRGHAGPASAQAAPAAPARHATKPAAVQHPAPVVATLRATRGDCWVRVSRGDHVVWIGTLRQGRTLKLGLAQRLVVRLGAPWNVDAQVAGRTLAPFPHRPMDVVLAA